MNDKQISPVVGIAVGVVVLLIALGLGYKFFLAPAALPNPADHPPRAGYTQLPGGAGYPGGGTTGYPGSAAAPAAQAPAASTP